MDSPNHTFTPRKPAFSYAEAAKGPASQNVEKKVLELLEKASIEPKTPIKKAASMKTLAAPGKQQKNTADQPNTARTPKNKKATTETVQPAWKPASVPARPAWTFKPASEQLRSTDQLKLIPQQSKKSIEPKPCPTESTPATKKVHSPVELSPAAELLARHLSQENKPTSPAKSPGKEAAETLTPWKTASLGAWMKPLPATSSPVGSLDTSQAQTVTEAWQPSTLNSPEQKTHPSGHPIAASSETVTLRTPTRKPVSHSQSSFSAIDATLAQLATESPSAKASSSRDKAASSHIRSPSHDTRTSTSRVRSPLSHNGRTFTRPASTSPTGSTSTPQTGSTLNLRITSPTIQASIQRSHNPVASIHEASSKVTPSVTTTSSPLIETESPQPVTQSKSAVIQPARGSSTQPHSRSSPSQAGSSESRQFISISHKPSSPEHPSSLFSHPVDPSLRTTSLPAETTTSPASNTDTISAESPSSRQHIAISPRVTTTPEPQTNAESLAQTSTPRQRAFSKVKDILAAKSTSPNESVSKQPGDPATPPKPTTPRQPATPPRPAGLVLSPFLENLIYSPERRKAEAAAKEHQGSTTLQGNLGDDNILSSGQTTPRAGRISTPTSSRASSTTPTQATYNQSQARPTGKFAQYDQLVHQLRTMDSDYEILYGPLATQPIFVGAWADKFDRGKIFRSQKRQEQGWLQCAFRKGGRGPVPGFKAEGRRILYKGQPWSGSPHLPTPPPSPSSGAPSCSAPGDLAESVVSAVVAAVPAAPASDAVAAPVAPAVPAPAVVPAVSAPVVVAPAVEPWPVVAAAASPAVALPLAPAPPSAAGSSFFAPSAGDEAEAGPSTPATDPIQEEIDRVVTSEEQRRREAMMKTLASNRSLWEHRFGWDVQVRCQDESWQLHRDVLVAESDYFAARLPLPRGDGQPVDFCLDGHQVWQLAQALFFMYHHKYCPGVAASPIFDQAAASLNARVIDMHVGMYIAGASVACRSLMEHARRALEVVHEDLVREEEEIGRLLRTSTAEWIHHFHETLLAALTSLYAQPTAAWVVPLRVAVSRIVDLVLGNLLVNPVSRPIVNGPSWYWVNIQLLADNREFLDRGWIARVGTEAAQDPSVGEEEGG